MAWPTVIPTATWNRTIGTEGRSIDQILHPMLCAKSQMVDSIALGSQVDEPKVEWISSNTNSRIITAISATMAGSNSSTGIVLTSGQGLTIKVGALLRNASRATPIGTYKVDEIMQVTAISTDTLTVTRDYGRNGAVAGQGSTVHGATDTFEVIFTAVEEGSSPSVNKYVATSITYNETSILDFYLTATGTEMARRPMIAADNMQAQYENRMIELKNDLCQFMLYGAMNYGAGGTTDMQGSNSYVRTTKGILQALAQSGGNVDYTSTAVTEYGLNTLFANILTNGGDRTDPYKIFVHPSNARVIAGFGADKVRVERVDATWGRYVTNFLSDLGFTAEIVPDPLVSKSNLFVLNMSKVFLVPFRPWTKLEWGIDTGTPDGSDAYKMRILGEYTMKVVDPLKAHGCMTLLTWQ